MGKRNLRVGGFYHVYNQGVDKREVFMDPLDSFRFIKALEYFNTTGSTKFYELFRDEHGLVPREQLLVTKTKSKKHKKLVSIVAFCCNPDHFHIVLKQESKDGVSIFMKKMAVGYTNYFNSRYERSGSLFAGRYKSQEVKNDADLQYISAYVNLNNHVHDIPAEISSVVRSSMCDYSNPDGGCGFVDTSDVLFGFGGGRDEYLNFAHETVQFIAETRMTNKNFLKKELLE